MKALSHSAVWVFAQKMLIEWARVSWISRPTLSAFRVNTCAKSSSRDVETQDAIAQWSLRLQESLPLSDVKKLNWKTTLTCRSDWRTTKSNTCTHTVDRWALRTVRKLTCGGVELPMQCSRVEYPGAPQESVLYVTRGRDVYVALVVGSQYKASVSSSLTQLIWVLIIFDRIGASLLFVLAIR